MKKTKLEILKRRETLKIEEMSFGIVPLQSSSSTTDILHAEVDYNLNEVKPIFII